VREQKEGRKKHFLREESTKNKELERRGPGQLDTLQYLDNLQGRNKDLEEKDVKLEEKITRIVGGRVEEHWVGESVSINFLCRRPALTQRDSGGGEERRTKRGEREGRSSENLEIPIRRVENSKLEQLRTTEGKGGKEVRKKGKRII